MEYAEYLLGLISAIFLMIIGQIIQNYFTTRNLKNQQEHSEKILRQQRYHEDKKQALIKLDELVKKRYKTYHNFKQSIESFLDGSSGMFLSNELREDLRKKTSDLDAFIYEQQAKIYGPEPEPPEPPDWEDWARDISPQEELDERIKSRLGGLKLSMRNKIRKYISKE